jgi:hypothetical protein
VLDLAQLAFDLLGSGVCVEQSEGQFISERAARALEPLSGPRAIAEYLDGQSIDSVNTSKAIGGCRAKASRKNVFALQSPFGNPEDLEQKGSINSQESRDLVQLSSGEALSDGTDCLTCDRREVCSPMRHLSIIIRQMS